MNEDIVKGKWKEIKGKIRQQWAKLTDDDISQMKGSYEELAGHIQAKYGYQKEQVKKEIDSFLNTHGWRDQDRDSHGENHKGHNHKRDE